MYWGELRYGCFLQSGRTGRGLYNRMGAAKKHQGIKAGTTIKGTLPQ